MDHTRTTPRLPRCDTVLLDIDGTLVDSNGAHAAAWSDAFVAHGRHHAPEQVRCTLEGFPSGLLTEPSDEA